MAHWARRIAAAPHAVTAADLDELRAAGFDSAQVLRLTLFITLRMAFSTVNGVLGARPEQEYVDHVHPTVRDAWERAGGTVG